MMRHAFPESTRIDLFVLHQLLAGETAIATEIPSPLQMLMMLKFSFKF
jgi:hypothetical protein